MSRSYYNHRDDFSNRDVKSQCSKSLRRRAKVILSGVIPDQGLERPLPKRQERPFSREMKY